MAEKRTHKSVLADMMQYPRKHLHNTPDELTECCRIDGKIDFSLMARHGLIAYHPDTEAPNPNGNRKKPKFNLYPF